MLKCNVKGIEKGYPLQIEAEEVTEVAADNPFNVDFMRGLLQKVNMIALRSAVNNLEIDTIEAFKSPKVDIDLDSLLNDESALRAIHHLLFEINVEKGKLICPESGRVFVVSDGIPNMLLHEDEV